MSELFKVYLKIFLGFLYFIPILAKPTFKKDSRLFMPQNLEQEPIESALKAPTINLNIIVVPIVRESSSGESSVNYRPIAGPRIGKKTHSSETNRMDTMESSPFTDLDTMESSNGIDSTDNGDGPAPGIIQPQRRPIPPPMCKDSEVYDKELGQCIRRRPGTCPVCTRRG